MFKLQQLLLLSLFVIIFITCSRGQPVDPIQYPGTEHYYMRYTFPESINPVNATAMCEQKKHLGMVGYLATWNSLEEWEWANSNSLTITPAWFSGTDQYTGVDGVWFYSSGPEKYQPLYNLFFDKCYTTCVFGSIEPNLIPNEHWLHTSGSPTDRYWNNNGISAVIMSMICEFGGFEKPFLQAGPTTGGEVLITNLIGYDMSSLSVTLTKETDPAVSFSCGNIRVINSTHAYCTLPPNYTGRYSVLFSDAVGTSHKVIGWQFQPPFISSVYPNYNAGDLVTITGQNFGADLSKITVTVSQSAIPCNSITILTNSEAFRCTLSQSLTGDNKFLPVIISVDGITGKSFKASFYYSENKLFYSGFITSTSYYTSTYNYSQQLKVDGQAGHAFVVNSPVLRDFLNKTLPLPIPTSNFNSWTGAKYVGGTSYVYTQGPNIGQPASFYLEQTPDTTGWDSNTNLLYSLVNASLVAWTGSGSTLVEYGGFNPSFQSNTTNYIDTDGGSVPMYLDNYGTQFSSVLVIYNSTISLAYTRDFIQSQLSVTVPSGINGPFPISVTIDGTRSTTPNTQFIQYNPPNITSTTYTSTAGGLITLQGKSLSTVSIGAVMIHFSNGVTCSGLQYVTAHHTVTCTISPFYGNIFGTAQVGNQFSDPFEFQYNPPIVQSISPLVGSMNGTVTITGSGFYTDTSLLTVTLDTISCTNITIIVNHTKIQCYLPSGSGTHNVTLFLNGTSSNTNIQFTFPTPTITSIQFDQTNPTIITINGNNFDQSLSSVKIGPSFVIDPSFIQSITLNRIITILPNNSRDGPLIVDNQGMESPSKYLQIIPHINSVSPKPFTSGSIVSITGYYLSNTDIFDTPTNFTIQSTSTSTISLSCTNNYLSNGFLECIVPRGVNDFNITAINSPLKSNTLTGSYADPIVELSTSLYYTHGGLITIQGDSFGLNGSLSVLVGGVTTCTNPILLDDRNIECYYDAMIPPPADNISSIDIQVTTTSFGIKSGSNQVFLYLTDKLCPKNCSNHGQCQTWTGECICDTGYTSSFDCSVPDTVPPTIPPIVDPNNGNSNISSGSIQFNIAISHLREISIVGDVLKTISMKNITWTSTKLSNSSYYYRGNFSNDPVIVETYVTYFNQSSTITFAGEPFIMPPNSMKYEITVSNWQWVSSLGQLQVIYNSKTVKDVPIGCGNKQSTSVTSSTTSDQLYYFQIKNGGSILTAKFSSRMISDNRIIRSNVEMLDQNDPLYNEVSRNNTNSNEFNLLTAMITPHFTRSVTLDPSFSSLLTTTTTTTTNDGCKEKKSNAWKIAVIVVCSVVGATAIAVAAWFRTRQYLRNRESNNSLKSKMSSLK